MLDFLLCSIPKSNVDNPLIGLPILKSILNKNDYTSKILDFNIELYHKFINKEIFNEGDLNEWVDLDYMFRNKFPNSRYIEAYNKLLDEWVERILDYNPKFVGFTIFSSHNAYSAMSLSKLIRKKSDTIKIVVGGPATIWFNFKKLRANNIIDYCVRGYGEESILKILKGESFVGVNDDEHCKQVDISQTPPPDFTDLDLTLYTDQKVLYTYSSRGCTQNCDFCDVHDIWGKYNTRKVDSVIKDMIHGIKTHEINRFEFCDSLINGNLNHMESLCNGLKHYNFNWVGMFRIRKMKDSHYDLLKESGCILLKIGIESGNENVRKDMNKYFSNDQILSTINNLRRVGIKCALFFMTGYPSETNQNHEESKNLIKQFYDNGFGDTINQIRVAPLEIQNNNLELVKLKETGGQKYRYERYHDLRKHIQKFNFDIVGDDRMNIVVKGYEDKLKN